MKTASIYIFTFLSFILMATACSENDDVDCTIAIQSIQNQLQESDLLKSSAVEGDNYVLNFETKTITLPSNTVQSLTTNADEWKSTLTFVNGSTYTLPSIGTSIDKLITNVIVNPSGYNPLSAYAVMNLPALGRMKLIVHSKDGYRTPDITHFFRSIEKGQTVTILGLYPDYNNKVTLIYTDKDGNEHARSIIHIQTGKLQNPHLPQKTNVVTANLARMEPGMNLISSPGESEADTAIPYMIDADGEIRWMLDWANHPELNHIDIGCGLSRMKSGNYLNGDGYRNKLIEVNTVGEIVQSWDLGAMGYSFHHDVAENADGKLLATVSKISARLANGKDIRYNDYMLELDPVKGTITQVWDLAAMIDSARYELTDPSLPGAAFGQTQSNWAHNNAIVGVGDDYLATIRFQGVCKFNHAGGVKWIISPHRGWHDKYQNLLLKPLHADGTPITDPEIISGEKSGNDFEWPWGAHTAITLPNGNIMVFDNGYGRNFILSRFDDESLYSRAVEYEVNEKQRTVRQVWQFGKEGGHKYYAPARSSVQYLPQTGNRLFCPGMSNALSDGSSGGRVVEIDPDTQQIIFELEIPSVVYQRANRITLYPDNL
ncbi:aryl-sulfate sulfotransferase [Parabacteroides sp. GYB001]|uniref:aryl-sulfate sulfotransferase n=1 Tax=Parabacteroides leei TaxID=2939491 RepID=UPI0020179E9C|nr:aryl-sulfate sulfotransferase [Parabacteroides leei]MCL3850445.1 aryl-sulfate sulfotransferase [Parabacteroides leei]